VLVGGEGAVLLDHRFALGIAGYGLANEIKGPRSSDGSESVLGFGYGGAVLRYHWIGKKIPISLSLGTLIGAGGLTLLKKSGESDFEFDEPDEANGYFVAEPALQANLHLTRWMRAGISGSYRFVRGPSLASIEDSDLEGVHAGAHIQFGWF
jgi:hypothetical protein